MACHLSYRMQKGKRSVRKRCEKSSFNKVRKREMELCEGSFFSTLPSITFRRQRKSIMYHSFTSCNSIPQLASLEHTSLQEALTTCPAHQQRKLSLPVDPQKLIRKATNVAWGCKLLYKFQVFLLFLKLHRSIMKL